MDSAVQLLEQIENDGETLAIIVRNDYSVDGVHFLTPPLYSQQLAQMHHPKGKVTTPHTHNEVKREVKYTLETLFIKKGIIRVDLYTADRTFVCSRELKAGDVVLLVSGGHGFEVIEDLEMIEIKQGPYAGEADKIQFKKMERAHDPGQ